MCACSEPLYAGNWFMVVTARCPIFEVEVLNNYLMVLLHKDAY